MSKKLWRAAVHVFPCPLPASLFSCCVLHRHQRGWLSMDHKPVRINYVELNVANIERSKAFYGAAFGWTFTSYGPQYCEFDDGAMKGGFLLTPAADIRVGGPLVILYSDQLDTVSSAIKAAGGKITKDVFSFPGGSRFHFADPDGYELAVWKKAEEESGGKDE